MKFVSPAVVSPAAGAVFEIASDATWPDMTFQTDVNGSHVWKWSIKWPPTSMAATGTRQTPDNKWNAKEAFDNLGGHFTVTAMSGSQTATITGKIVGINPLPDDVKQYTTKRPLGDEFIFILKQETCLKHFDEKKGREPIYAGDHGIGIAQLTSPVPKYEEAWNWKKNIEKGLDRYRLNRQRADTYLKTGPTYTPEQLFLETARMYNAGHKHHYHIIDPKTKQWTRHSEILCARSGSDPRYAHSNLGWDITDPENAGKTVDQLLQRDKDDYNKHSKAPGGKHKDSHWTISGTCYADSVLARKKNP
jgi:hypothetical protein